MFNSIGSTELAVNVCVPMTVRFAIHEGLKCYILLLFCCALLSISHDKSAPLHATISRLVNKRCNDDILSYRTYDMLIVAKSVFCVCGSVPF